MGSTYTGFIISLFLSFVYLVGYVKKTTADFGRAQKAETKNTLVTCTVEIMFDVAIVLYIGLVSNNCTVRAERTAIDQQFHPAVHGRGCTGLSPRLHSLEMGSGHCWTLALASQPLLQETASLFLDLGNHIHCFNKN
jgi:hypothetical protein